VCSSDLFGGLLEAAEPITAPPHELTGEPAAKQIAAPDVPDVTQAPAEPAAKPRE